MSKHKLRELNPKKALLSEDFIVRAIMECFLNNDPEGVIEVASIYLKTRNKVESA